MWWVHQNLETNIWHVYVRRNLKDAGGTGWDKLWATLSTSFLLVFTKEMCKRTSTSHHHQGPESSPWSWWLLRWWWWWVSQVFLNFFSLCFPMPLILQSQWNKGHSLDSNFLRLWVWVAVSKGFHVNVFHVDHWSQQFNCNKNTTGVLDTIIYSLLVVIRCDILFKDYPLKRCWTCWMTMVTILMTNILQSFREGLNMIDHLQERNIYEEQLQLKGMYFTLEIHLNWVK